MKKRIKQLFDRKEKGICSIFITAGFPEKESLLNLVPLLDKNGVDLIEIGIPFSDPLADGTTIQQSSEVALKNGMNLSLLFEQLKELRKSTEVPIVLMGYFNPIFQFGLEAFLERCQQVGVDGVIIPDVSFELYHSHYEVLFEQFEVPLIFLASANNPERIVQIDQKSKAFIYLLSSASITGKQNTFSAEQLDAFKDVRELNLKSPVLLGFGIHNRETVKIAHHYFEGSIIGSAFIRALENKKPVQEFLQQVGY